MTMGSLLTSQLIKTEHSSIDIINLYTNLMAIGNENECVHFR